ncbi:class I SAM-dependent methyltransferase [Aquimarina sp. ERC-38]|uniref:SAM-dependent methyltransferase n=1 Tax=Aquimarina sp. ERC-38 TaxID=2949996 RepID=UPI0022467417|nr:class I SAM-dependent methyltransferase [Aquimarina sp. ERC-38]UZO79508.1 class I SAM-dependent methyltransferase [Aquimarina sp. ERC-38]
MLKNPQDWFQTWFDTPYYHILYKERNYKEAQNFMNNLTSYLKLVKDDQVLDLACGRGRHSLYLGTLGYNVTGIDLSERNIDYAQKFASDNVQFKVHDMRFPYPNRFKAVFNLFTSFGYFENEADNEQTIASIKKNIADGGRGVIDFMNTEYVIKNLVRKEIKVVDHIKFHIKRYIQDDYIIKEIKFTDGDQSYFYTEKVKIITLEKFKTYFKNCNIELIDTFGNYELQAFHKEHSPRLILVFK